MAPVDLHSRVDELLREQQNTELQSAVAIFAERRESGTGKYQTLLPLEQPGPGQQYRFEVDLDACTSCKSCVSACHHLNGLDQDETWRRVGTLEQTRPGFLAFTQTITASCHHCLEPACALGCPVKAYEKDPITGIVRHLDDQCIGCQYCQMMCPYDVPVYNSRLGIVRKCDMCSQRITQGEAPACAQACPTDAIAIGIVDQAALATAAFLPAAAHPDITRPSTLYKKREALPEGIRAANQYQLQEQAAHQPLVWMLLLSQAGVGMLLWEALGYAGDVVPPPAVAGTAVLLVILALGLATLHLGQPQKAWRFMLGLKTSWMSREILVFHLFLLAATMEFIGDGFAARTWTPGKSLLLGTGVLGVFCSSMIYIETRRASWSRFRCLMRFGGSTLLLGLFGVLLVLLFAPSDWVRTPPLLLSLSLGILLLKCSLEAREFSRLLLRWRMLGYWTWLRWLAAWVCACALIFALTGTQTMALLILAATAGFIGEYCERSLFFRSAFVRGMPGL